VSELGEEAAAEKEEEPGTSKKKKLAIVVVGISAFGLLVLSGAVTAILKWVFGAAFVAGLLGGGWYLVRKRWYALKASRGETRAKELEAKTEQVKKQTVEEQLAELKRRKSG
jgi:hypothetical protein